MKFLQKLAYASGLLSLMMAATPDDELQKNQFAFATQVNCGGRTWTHDELLGNVGGRPVYTIINQNRIYIRWDGNPDQSRKSQAFDNTAILLHMDNNRFPNDANGNRIVNSCVNSIDPSTMGNNYLGTQQGNMIPCNGKPITDGLRLGTYIGGDNVKTYQYAIIKDGLLRVNFHRETNTYSRDAISMGLIRQTIEGENGSSMNPNMGFTLNYNEVLSCFWNELPKNPDSVVDPEPNCPGGPTLGTISNVSQTALRFSYSGNGIPNIDWRIKSGSTVVRSGKTGTLSSTNVDISFSTLSAGNYTLEIEGGDCKSSVSTSNFNITPPNCAGGPTIATIANASTTALMLTVNGTNIPNLTWRIKKNGNTVANGKTGGLTANSVQITYPAQSLGTYTLEIEGGDCVSSVSSKSFDITSADSRMPCALGPNLKGISDPKSTELVFNFHGENVASIDWKIMKGSNMMRSARVNLQSDRPKITFAALPDGDYILAIEGGSCKSSVQTMAFKVGEALPIHISRFDGTPVSNGVELSWNVAEEKDGKGFEIIRFDSQMKSGSVIGTMPLSDKRVGEYKFLDKAPLYGNNYYQLKMVDEDGSFLTSRIITVRYDAISEAVVAPNPVKELVSVEFVSKTAGKGKVETYSLTGVKMNTTQSDIVAGKNKISLNVTGLNDGHYFLKVYYGDQEMNMRFFKIR
ncbi:T9SS type A sorting domain-containing protein [Dyadobacter chenwenxiniae]|uniref:T9SS type A sorting domain-containing protein n=1 Tax=Dyadobacter chenwenxiniae TaxID=2906456 RepID=A0A9X1PKX4_9BACT|nr:T9SS type A sorting domain-containing protein [Dyadobacter chenwenxiniae]MCF0062798.1 T9SS type A sorting domain-containing protein [Dyadobacter chenwenxiniae]UON85027.1 T9SS type A sorting domain-containing protein [Dyadobacter chenwenxiniae]